MVTKQSSRTTEDSKSIVFKTALFLCGLVILTTILLQLYYLNVNPGFAIKYSYVTNIISPLTYSIVSVSYTHLDVYKRQCKDAVPPV